MGASPFANAFSAMRVLSSGSARSAVSVHRMYRCSYVTVKVYTVSNAVPGLKDFGFKRDLVLVAFLKDPAALTSVTRWDR